MLRTEDELKRSIDDNQFLVGLRGLQVDEQLYERLCVDLHELADTWRDKTTIDKMMAADLYIIGSVAAHAARKTRELKLSSGDRVEDVAHELDALVGKCFGL